MTDDFSILDTLDLTGPVELTELSDTSWTLQAQTTEGTYRYSYRRLDLMEAYTLSQRVCEHGVINTAYWTRSLELTCSPILERFFDVNEGSDDEG